MMQGAAVIEARGVSKGFDRQRGQLHRLWRVLAGSAPDNAFWALRDVDLTVGQGEAVGIVGRNGSGKSTLLQILCGTLEPTAGRVARSGRISAMLELGAGFNPDFTGRENAGLSATAQGLTARQVDDRMDGIAAFADIGPYFDRPLREYSSGMQARLAFAVAIHVDATVLVVDEILSVGDSAFQRKCRGHMQAFLDSGGTVIFVSHDPGAVTELCKRAVWLEAGRKMMDGNAVAVMKAYVDSLYGIGADGDGSAAGRQEAPADDAYWTGRARMEVSAFLPDSPAHGFGGCRIEDCFLSRDGSTPAFSILAGETVTLHVRARAGRQIDSPIVGFMFRDSAGQNLFGDNTYLAYRDRPVSVPPGRLFEARLSFVMPYLPAGRYSFAPSVIEGTQQNHVHLDWREEAVFVDVTASPVRAGKVGLVMKSIVTEPADFSQNTQTSGQVAGQAPDGASPARRKNG